ncbi:MAG: FxLYD domain-containing protein [Deltaproteobacteria bacterium]|nr:FxLYD domain-containing protein [Deltaproteobacteria bacterium]
MTKFLTVVSTAALLGLGSSAAADWLVMQDGSRLETQGTWETRGRLLVFTNAAGKLASVRVSEVNLDASDQATREAQEAAEAARSEAEPEAPKKKSPVLVLTDADVAHVEEEEAATVVEEGEDASAAAASPLTVVNWEQEEVADGQGVIVRGTLRNDGTSVATRIEVIVQVLNSEGEIVGTQTAQLTSSNLGATEILNFRTQFPDLNGFDTARFDITSRGFEAAPRPSADDDGALPPSAEGSEVAAEAG